MNKLSYTHEDFIQHLRESVAIRQQEPLRSKIRSAKLVYGAGNGGYRGVCHYEAWKNGKLVPFVEIAATGEESPVQLAGTVIHELGHVISDRNAGHNREWKANCKQLGLLNAQAVGTVYTLDESFAGDLRHEIERMIEIGIADGQPQFGISPLLGTRLLPKLKLRRCPMGTGARGGKSRGTGSGSRLRLYVCNCETPVKVRVASDDFQAQCLRCNTPFKRA